MRINVTRSSMPCFEEYCEEIRGLWDSRWLTNMGVKHEEFRSKLCSYLGVERIDLFSNGHMSLELALQALDVKGEVITTPYTFASTTHAIVRNGLEPVFCDIEPGYCTMDPARIEDLITERTVAILPVHVYGTLCDVDAIEAIAKKHGLKVIYDAAHAFGERYKGRGAGSFGDMSCFSFHATKVFHSIEGGAVCVNNAEYADRLARLKNFGIRDSETVDQIGANAKMNEFSAAMGLCNLRHVDEDIAGRRRAVERYMKNLSGIPGISFVKQRPGVESNYSYFPVFFDPEEFGASRDDVMAKLARNDIGTRKYFYPLTSEFACYGGRFDPEATPVALETSRRVLALPLYSDLADSDVDAICAIITDSQGKA